MWISAQSVNFGISLSYLLSGVKVICNTRSPDSYPVFPDIMSNSFANSNVPVCAHLKTYIKASKGSTVGSGQRSRPR